MSPETPAEIVFATAYVSWDAMGRRGANFAQDRLARRLVNEPSFEVMLAEPYRSFLSPLASAIRRQPSTSTLPDRRHRRFRPLRWRRRDPVDVGALERSVRRYDKRLERAILRMGLREPRVITTNPLLAGLAPFDWAHSVTFFATDDWRAYGKHRQWWPAYEKSFRRFALSGRRLCAVSAPIVERIAPVGPAIVVPNGIEPTEWLPLPPAPKWMAELPAPRLLYLGSLDSRLDLRALEALAEHMPHATLLLVGPAIDTGALNSLQERQKNIVVRPSVDRREVAGITRAANVCLIPHESNLLTQAMSPLKLYEYLAAGRPVVATDLPPLREISDRISLVRPGEDWAPHVENALAQEPPTELERVGFVRENSWVARQDRLLELALAE